MSAAPSNAGIITDATGERHIPESTRADGSVRKAIKIRPGYKPPEDAEIYKNRTAETFRNRYKGGVIGAEAAAPSTSPPGTASASSSSAAANKNAKRREARKKAKAGAGADDGKEGEAVECEAGAKKLATAPPAHFFEGKDDKSKAVSGNGAEAPLADPEAERKKKARNLTKKLKQAKELKSKKDDGQSLLPEQFAKVIKINELVRELAALGFDAEGEPVEDGGNAEEARGEAKKDEAPA